MRTATRPPAQVKLSPRAKAKLKPAASLKAFRKLWAPRPQNIPQQTAYVSEADELYFGGQAGGGKALPLNAIIPTPAGYRRMGDMQVGGEVFGMDGKIYRIVGTSDVMLNHQLFDVEFDDGTIIRADADHRWLTFTYAERMSLLTRSEEYRARRRANRPSRGTGAKPHLAARNAARAAKHVSEPVTGGVRSTIQIRDTLYADNKKRLNHAIPVAEPLDLPEQELPIDPYMLGFWLGDGASSAGRVTIGGEYIEEARRILAEAGYPITKIPCETYTYTVKGLQKQLRLAGLLKNKRIPECYLFASFDQRLALLQGLMDTDGYAAKDGQCEFYSSRRAFIESVSRLLHTLGIKHAIRAKKPPLGTHHKESYRIKFVAPFIVFRLPTKAVRQNTELRATQKWRYIVDVREVDSEPVKCIAIDSPDHLYLAGEACVPTHNSDLILGLAITKHDQTIIFRREYPQIKGLVRRSRQIIKRRAKYNKTDKTWELPGGRILEFGAVQHPDDCEKYMGIPHDLIAFDEITHFLEEQYRFLIGWNRSTNPRQRCRVVVTGNPPTSAEGRWVIRYWAPWLDKRHPNPAKPGELRWFAVIDGVDVEVAGPEPFEHQGADGETETIRPRSRTFIPSSLADNPDLARTNYKSVLQGLPEPLRSQLLKGDFTAGIEDDAWQVIPTAWVEAAQERWRQRTRPAIPLTAIGIDVARGGRDKTIIAKRYGDWFDSLKAHPGSTTPNGRIIAGLVLPEIPKEDDPWINVDIIGVGTSPYDAIAEHHKKTYACNGAEKSHKRDRTGRLKIANKRAEWYWRLREALDPQYNPTLALPDDAELLADLTAPRWLLTVQGILLESKEDVMERIGRSPDRGDALAYAYAEPPTPKKATPQTITFSSW